MMMVMVMVMVMVMMMVMMMMMMMMMVISHLVHMSRDGTRRWKRAAGNRGARSRDAVGVIRRQEPFKTTSFIASSFTNDS